MRKRVSELRVLVADDEPMMRQYVRLALEHFGYMAIEAFDGIDALAAWHNDDGRIDVVVTDVDMPRMNGCALAETLWETDPAIPVIFVSGRPADPVVETHTIQRNAQFLSKPFTPAALAGVIVGAITRTRHDPDIPMEKTASPDAE